MRNAVHNQAYQLMITEADYLAGEQDGQQKHEYIDGQVYAMSGASANHNRLAGNLYGELRQHLKGQPCQAYTADMKVKVDTRYFYPDVMVDCSAVDGYFTETPIILIEVLSKSTKQTDKTIKLDTYTSIPTLQEYLLVEQDFVEIELLRWRTGWKAEHYFLGDSIVFESIGLQLTVAEIYERVTNDDMNEWLVAQKDN
ncbi:MAG: Uma2 family endonuclease [Moraxellaceae bacterium]